MRRDTIGIHEGDGMEASNARVDWRRVLGRGSVIGVVLGSHLALLVGILAPDHRRPQHEPGAAVRSAVTQVLLLVPQPATSRAHAAHAVRRPRVRPTLAPAMPVRTAQASAPLRAGLTATPPASADTPAYIAGGGFAARLDVAQAPPRAPKLPGGQRYLASAFQFVPVEQQSIAGKVQKVAGLIFGRVDPTCANAAHELARSRAQILADGYTRDDLERLQHEHHCV